MDLAVALAALIGTTQEIAGFILGTVLTVVLVISLTWILSDSQGRGGNFLFILSGTLGAVIATLFGWFPIWVPVFIVIIVAFISIDPLSVRSGRSD